MRSLEEHLRPKSSPNDPLYDALGMALVLATAAALLAPNRQSLGYRFDEAVAGQMSSSLLLPAMGFLLALRCGTIDLSVWSAAALGGLVTAALMNAGVSSELAMVGGVAAGAALGAINGLLVAMARLPSVLATALTAAAAMWVGRQFCAGRQLAVSEDAFAAWQPLIISRMLLVVGVYALTMIVLMVGGNRLARRGHSLPPRRSLLAALWASGALSAAGGAFWLLEYGHSPVLTGPIGDLRIPAAAVLAGAAFFSGPRRALLAGVCLPLALLLATVWRQGIWLDLRLGRSLQLLLPIGMTLLTQAAIRHAVPSWRRGRRHVAACAAAGGAGLLVFAFASTAESLPLHRALQWSGLLLCLAGTAGAFLPARKTA